jgi:glutathione S-transferase
MSTSQTITLFHAPQSRSSGVLALLEELNAPYELKILNMKAGEQRQSAYLAVNPLGKVPAILHRDALVTEQVAIYIYLADLFPEAGLAPTIDNPRRGLYLRWMAYYAACYEPALVDLAMKREPAPPAMSPYGGNFQTMLKTVVDQLAQAPYLLGDTFSAVDLLWGFAFQWGMMFDLLPKTPIIVDYSGRVTQRPSIVKIMAMDAELAAQHQAARASTQT